MLFLRQRLASNDIHSRQQQQKNKKTKNKKKSFRGGSIEEAKYQNHLGNFTNDASLDISTFGICFARVSVLKVYEF